MYCSNTYFSIRLMRVSWNDMSMINGIKSVDRIPNVLASRHTHVRMNTTRISGVSHVEWKRMMPQLLDLPFIAVNACKYTPRETGAHHMLLGTMVDAKREEETKSG